MKIGDWTCEASLWTIEGIQSQVESKGKRGTNTTTTSDVFVLKNLIFKPITN
jgi:uncharacterized protein YaaR (DUF327 family)